MHDHVDTIAQRRLPDWCCEGRVDQLDRPHDRRNLVEIKSIVREPGDRTKIAVTSREKAVDPVGACVGIKGSRGSSGGP